MAGLIGLTSGDLDIQDALGAVHWRYDGDWIPHPVVRLTTTLPVAVEQEDGRAIVRARWGFPVGAGRPVGNCRDDRLTDSRMWASMFGTSHCLFAATGVYEMVRDGSKKTSWWFRRVDGDPIVMPGLIGERTVHGENRLCAAIVTTEPSAFFGRFHDRQVCSLDEAGRDKWMGETDKEKLFKLLRPAPDDEWEAVPVDGKIFGKGIREMEDLVETGRPVRHGDKMPGQQTLGL